MENSVRPDNPMSDRMILNLQIRGSAMTLKTARANHTSTAGVHSVSQRVKCHWKVDIAAFRMHRRGRRSRSTINLRTFCISRKAARDTFEPTSTVSKPVIVGSQSCKDVCRESKAQRCRPSAACGASAQFASGGRNEQLPAVLCNIGSARAM